MELLILLVKRRGQLVSRAEIAERLWGRDVFLDVDHSINTAIRKVRQSLGDDPDKPRFVETVVGKGYRFAAPVICGDGSSSPQVEALPSSIKSLLLVQKCAPRNVYGVRKRCRWPSSGTLHQQVSPESARPRLCRRFFPAWLVPGNRYAQPGASVSSTTASENPISRYSKRFDGFASNLTATAFFLCLYVTVLRGWCKCRDS